MENGEMKFAAENPEKREKFKDLVIFTTTLYKDDKMSTLRAKLANKMLANANELGIKVVIVDGGSNDDFINNAHGFENVNFQLAPELSMGDSRRQALKVAMSMAQAGVETNFLWLEPEKASLITEKNLQTMLDQLRGGQADIIMPHRPKKDTRPRLQSWIEKRANARANQKVSPIDGEDVDWWFGPKMFNETSAQYFLNYQGQPDKWDSIVTPVLEAYQGGQRIKSVDVDFEYTPEEKAYEEGDKELQRKRLAQYSRILSSLGDDYWHKELEK